MQIKGGKSGRELLSGSAVNVYRCRGHVVGSRLGYEALSENWATTPMKYLKGCQGYSTKP